MPAEQDNVFRASEGDRYFERNQQGYEHFEASADFPTKLIELYQLKPSNILEIGAANGVRLAYLHRQLNSACVAVEPSAKAIEDGEKKFPFIKFVQAVSASIPLETSFDLVIINYVLHWVDRSTLFQSLSEIDRLVADGGFLIIGDFYPSRPRRVKYHHLANQDVWTYKQDYAAPFLASNLYTLVSVITGEHASSHLQGHVNENSRSATWLLRKTLHGQYGESLYSPHGQTHSS